ncbi:hypothetical protein [Breznakiella homolactica]|uniref:Uncharacterized protein n=1 Tax=Breznakiella homolactica TaxID=2798577 RepID=A0A7T8B9S8_9SPIR|nr:hypothetical protein [Breznakiella homolactica]QQO09919.1 hypothetical protein JFL75_03130 [Breznakiella homolactica]
MAEVIPSRVLNYLYMYLDCGFLLFLAVLLLVQKRRLAFITGVLAGLLYFAVDYGIFYKFLGTRTVQGMPAGPFLFWLSMSYGFTNFVWIWLWLDRDKRLFEWSLLIVAGWLTVALLSRSFGGPMGEIAISRGTNSYHGIMALLMFIGYAIVCIYNMNRKEGAPVIPVLWLLIIGILVQFSWEAVLLVTGIRSPGWRPLIVDSLIETNLGIPYMYFIHQAVTKRFSPDGRRLQKS